MSKLGKKVLALKARELYLLAVVTKTTPKPRYDGERIVSDAGKLGWNIPALARAAGLSYKTTARFVSGDVQTATTAAKLATALGKTARRYFSHVEAA